MNAGNVKSCRFCLKTSNDNDFDIIEEITKQMLDVLLLKLDLDVSKEPVMCHGCAMKLQSAVDFKSACLSTEKKILPISRPAENVGRGSDGLNDQKVCRFCKKIMEGGQYTNLQEMKENIFILDIVEKHIPELSLCVTEELATCDSCLHSLQNLLSFITTCMDTEEKIKLTRDGTNAEEQLKLNDSGIANVIKKSKEYDKNEEAVFIKKEIEYEITIEVNNLEENMKNEEIKFEPYSHDSFLAAMELGKMREKFNDTISSIISTKRDANRAFLNSEEYSARIVNVKQSKIVLRTPGMKKTMKHHKIVRRYDVLTVDGIERLIKPMDANSKQILYYITNEELFDILHTTHLRIGHGGRNRMFADVKNNYGNITKESVMIYLRLCAQCQRKSCQPKRGLTSKPNLRSALESRARVDLIDMKSQSCNGFRFIMVYQDYLTKFVLLRALKTKRAKEVASHLLDIYTTFGAPVILDSDNGQDFVDSILAELQAMWSDVEIVSGKPKQSQDQELSEQAKKDIEEMLITWMAENKSTDWLLGIKFVQFQKNRARHSGINQSPYEAMFGCPVRVGLASVDVPLGGILDIRTEEDVDALIEETETQHTIVSGDSESEEDVGNDATQNVETASTSSLIPIRSSRLSQTGFPGDREPCKCIACLTVLPSGEDVNHDSICSNCERKENIANDLKRSIECLEQHTNKLRRLSNWRFSENLEGTTRHIPVPDLDRSQESPRNVLAVEDK